LPDPERLQAIIRSGPIDLELGLNDNQAARLVALAGLLARWGDRINLSGHRSEAEILERLIVDALALGSAIRQLMGRWPDRIVDLGSGAGIPGLPLAIAHPETMIELVEARERRHHFQRAACRELEIRNAVPRLGRIETLEPSLVPLVVAQAVGPIEAVALLAERWLLAGGWLIIPSGAEPPHFEPGSGWIQHGTRPYSVPGSGIRRSIWFGQRSVGDSESP